MARSRRKTPIMGNAGRSEKRDKQLANRRLRRIVRERLRLPWYVLIEYEDWSWSGIYIAVLEYDDLPRLREVSDVWAMAKDGKHRFDAQRWPELMRK